MKGLSDITGQFVDNTYCWVTKEGWYIDWYPAHKKWEPTTITGPYKTWPEAAKALKEQKVP